jgi:hypothetical protein
MLTAGAQSPSPDDTVELNAPSDDSRLDLPPRDAFLAEILASEFAY